MEKYQVDDPLEAFQIHGVSGMWGVFFAGVFHREYGVLYTENWTFLGVQCLGILVISLWSGVMFWALFKLFRDRFRISRLNEMMGGDIINHYKIDDEILKIMEYQFESVYDFDH